jgi:MFS family permease
MSRQQGSAAPVALALRVVLPFAIGYFLSYLYRSVNAVLAPEIGRTIQLEAADIGLMTGIYFISFAAFQLPLGILLDRFGPRRVEAVLLMAAAVGALAFSLAEGVPALVLGRALVGLGVSSCLMAPLKANVQWFARDKLPLMNGVILSAGGLGAVAATAPVQAALAFTDWRGVYGGVAALTVASGMLLWLAVPDRPTAAAGRLGQQLREVLEIYRDPIFRRIAPVTMVSLGGFMAVQGLWAGPWLQDVAGLSPQGAAAGLTTMAAAMAAGFLSIGAIAERLERLGVPPIAVSGAGMAAYALASLAMAAGWAGAPLLLSAVYGFSGAAATLNYAVLTQRFPPHLAGRANTSLNLVIFVSAFSVQWGIGWVIGLWEKVDGRWPPQAYAVALTVPLALNVLALVWFIPAARTATAR